MTRLILVLAALGALGLPVRAQATFSPDAAGSIPNWRVLAPIAIPGQSDADKLPVSLVQGQNVLMLKVINEVNSWQACARLLRGEVPVTNLKISLTPQ